MFKRSIDRRFESLSCNRGIPISAASLSIEPILRHISPQRFCHTTHQNTALHMVETGSET